MFRKAVPNCGLRLICGIGPKVTKHISNVVTISAQLTMSAKPWYADENPEVVDQETNKPGGLVRKASKYHPGIEMDNGCGAMFVVAISENVSSQREWVPKDEYEKKMQKCLKKRNDGFLRGIGKNRKNKGIVFTDTKTERLCERL